MIRTFLMSAALAAAALSAPAAAHKPLKVKELVNLDPTKGYLLVRLAPKGSLVAFARLSGGGLPMYGNPMSKKEYDVGIAAGGNILSTDGKSNLYVIPVNPGTWLITSAGNTVFALGTYGFEIGAGEVVNIGTVLTGREDGKSPIPEIAAAKLSPDLVSFGTLMNIVMTDALLLRPATGLETVPQGLTVFPQRVAAIQSDIRFPNLGGFMINRALGLPPMQHMPLEEPAN
jgi:hypothetical protein